MKGQACIICGGVKYSYLFASHGSRIVRCTGCGLLSQAESRLKSKSMFSATGSLEQAAASATKSQAWNEGETEQEASTRYVRILIDCGLRRGLIGVFGVSESHPVIEELRQQGFEVEIFSQTEPRQIQLPDQAQRKFRCIFLIDSLETAVAPFPFLERVWHLLDDDGLLINIGISLDCQSARFFGREWIGWRPQNKFYFGTVTLQLLLERTGFNKIFALPDCRLYTLEHILERARWYPGTMLTRLIRFTFPLIPSKLRQTRVRIQSSRVIVTAQKNVERCPRKVSIIMPVFNEKASFEQTFKQVLDKQIAGVENKEIVVVESNSTDGTRELVRTCEDYAGVKVIYEDRPRGKGHAVRTGFTHATGEIILIQDADLEYDAEDYDELLEPILEFRQAFVLGSRSSGDWKMRTFTGQPGLAFLMNFGQLIFATLLNVLYRQHMSDPFTMYKVFRRECLYGLFFECNRFDFDWELVIKLVRKGYVPYEVPVNYESRSFQEGKKVRIIRDPITWMIAGFKYRFATPFDKQCPRYTFQNKESTMDSCQPAPPVEQTH